MNEPYGMLVTAGQDDVVKVWDLCDGEVTGQLRGHIGESGLPNLATEDICTIADLPGSVKAMQVEDTLCLTGGSDGTIRLWDLRVVEDYEDRLKRESVNKAQQDPLDRIAEQKAHDQDEDDDEDWEEGPSGYTDFTQSSQLEGQGPCVRVLEGHSKSVTSLYYEDGCLVSGHLVTGLGREQY
jgi:division protein 1